nr:unnamed protein product [Callosobruchus chinensis]
MAFMLKEIWSRAYKHMKDVLNTSLSMLMNCFKGKEIHSGNIEAVVTKEKAKFPQDFFPELIKW